MRTGSTFCVDLDVLVGDVDRCVDEEIDLLFAARDGGRTTSGGGAVGIRMPNGPLRNELPSCFNESPSELPTERQKLLCPVPGTCACPA